MRPRGQWACAFVYTYISLNLTAYVPHALLYGHADRIGCKPGSLQQGYRSTMQVRPSTVHKTQKVVLRRGIEPRSCRYGSRADLKTTYTSRYTSEEAIKTIDFADIYHFSSSDSQTCRVVDRYALLRGVQQASMRVLTTNLTRRAGLMVPSCR